MLGLVVASGCAGKAEGPESGFSDGTPEFPAPPEGQGVQLLSTARIEAGAEEFHCRYVVLPDRPLDIATFEHRYTPGSHHMLLYPTDLGPGDVDGEVFDCDSRGDLHRTGVAYGGSEPEGALTYPEGIALPFEPGTVVLLESHYVNSSPDIIDAEIRVNLWFAQEPVDMHAGTLFFYDWHILVPPRGEASADMHCRIPQDISLAYAVSHMHRRGTRFTSELIRPGEEPETLHESSSWSAPTPDVYDPPLQLRAGDAVEFGCDYHNDLDTTVIEGPSAETDEMCIFIGGYWPKMPQEDELCQGEGSGPILDGSMSCEQTVDCMVDAGVGSWVEGQQCVADTCAESAAALSSFVVCVDEHDCWGSEGCVAASCSAEWTGCTAAGC